MLQLLETSPSLVKGSRIILVTDGDETDAPYVKDVAPQLLTAGIIVDAILLTSSAADSLIALADQTGASAA